MNLQILDKYTPTYKLEEFKKSDYNMTKTAMQSASDIGFNEKSICQLLTT